jgi:hypothetical protein
MKTASAKAKGRKLQQTVRDAVLKAFPSLGARDVESRGMGQSGDDVVLSEAAFKLFPFSVECKNLARVAVYRYYEQRSPTQGQVLVVVKENGKKPLAILDFEHFMELIKK